MLKTPLIFTALVSLAVASRLLDHAPNLAAVAAASMFAGWYFKNRLLAVAAPLAAMLISDVCFLGGYQPLVMVAVYGSFLAPLLFSRFIGRDRTPAGLLGRAAVGSLAASVLFYVTTNFAVWVASGYYAHTGAGLLECYTAALPFLRFTIAGDLAFTMMLFGGYLAAQRAAAVLTPVTRLAFAK